MLLMDQSQSVESIILTRIIIRFVFHQSTPLMKVLLLGSTLLLVGYCYKVLQLILTDLSCMELCYLILDHAWSNGV